MIITMIKSRVREVAEAHGVTSSYALQQVLGVAPTVAARLWQDKVTRFSVETLDKLCDAFDCQPGDLLIRLPNKKKGGKK